MSERLVYPERKVQVDILALDNYEVDIHFRVKLREPCQAVMRITSISIDDARTHGLSCMDAGTTDCPVYTLPGCSLLLIACWTSVWQTLFCPNMIQTLWWKSRETNHRSQTVGLAAAYH